MWAKVQEASYSINVVVTYSLKPHVHSRVQLSKADVAECHLRVGHDRGDDRGVALGSVARAVVSLVEPRHEGRVIPPQAHGQNHTTRHGTAHDLHSTQPHEVGGTSGLAVLVVHEVDLRRSLDVDNVVLDDLAVLDVHTAELLELAVLGGELRDDGELAGSVDLVVGTAAVEVGHVDAVRVPGAAGLIADASLLALLAGALVKAGLAARVRRDVGCTGVGLPDVKFVAARALLVKVALFLVLVMHSVGQGE